MRRGRGKNKASPDTRSLDIVVLEHVFSRHNVLNDYSLSTNVIGDVQKIRINFIVCVSMDRIHGHSLPRSQLH